MVKDERLVGPSKHLFRGGRSTVKEARRDGCQPGDLIVRSVKD